MDTRDFRDPSGKSIARVEAVRAVVDDFVQRRVGDRIGLIVLGDAPSPQLPFTLDHATVREMIAEMLPGMADRARRSVIPSGSQPRCSRTATPRESTRAASRRNQLEQIYATLDRITPSTQKTLTWRPVRELFYDPAARRWHCCLSTRPQCFL
jgi:hypothetical protein